LARFSPLWARRSKAWAPCSKLRRPSRWATSRPPRPWFSKTFSVTTNSGHGPNSKGRAAGGHNLRLLCFAPYRIQLPRHERQLDEAALILGVEDALCRLAIVRRFGPEDIGDERLRIAVVKRE